MFINVCTYVIDLWLQKHVWFLINWLFHLSLKAAPITALKSPTNLPKGTVKYVVSYLISPGLFQRTEPQLTESTFSTPRANTGNSQKPDDLRALTGLGRVSTSEIYCEADQGQI